MLLFLSILNIISLYFVVIKPIKLLTKHIEKPKKDEKFKKNLKELTDEAIKK